MPGMTHNLIRKLQKLFHAENLVDSVQSEERFGPFRNLLNVRYGNTYPNSTMDIYLCEENAPNHPVLFYVHGGGYTWGDKRSGDPNGGSNSFLWFFERFLKEGYHIVSINYAFAPDYLYPTPILQMSEAVQWLKTHGDDFSVSMKEVVFAGSSAGGQLVGQFTNIQINPDYAREMGISPVMKPGEIKAVLFNSALLDMERFGKTGSFVSDWLFVKCGQAYFDVKTLPGNATVISAKVTPFVTDAFPPTFISDANTASFSDQAFELDRKLTQLGVPHVLNFYQKSEKKLLHGFENKNDRYGLDNMDQMISFLKSLG